MNSDLEKPIIMWYFFGENLGKCGLQNFFLLFLFSFFFLMYTPIISVIVFLHGMLHVTYVYMKYTDYKWDKNV